MGLLGPARAYGLGRGFGNGAGAREEVRQVVIGGAHRPETDRLGGGGRLGGRFYVEKLALVEQVQKKAGRELTPLIELTAQLATARAATVTGSGDKGCLLRHNCWGSGGGRDVDLNSLIEALRSNKV